MKFKKCGQDVKIWDRAKVCFPERIEIGNSVIIDDFTLIIPGDEMAIGDFVHIGSLTSIFGGGKFIMEDFCGMGSGCRIITGGEDFSGACLTNPTIPPEFRTVKRSFVHLKKHTIITTNVTVFMGVTIGEGCVIAAGAVVTKDLDPWGIYMGMPAKRIKDRPKETILRMERELRKKYYDKDGNYISWKK